MESPTFSVLKIQFGHDCRNLGCNERGCELCRNNPDRRCKTHFREKYVDNVKRVLIAWCDALIQARVVDAVTGDEYIESEQTPGRLRDMFLQLFLLEGVAYEQKESEVGFANLTDEDFESMALLLNAMTNEPLLVPGKGCGGEHTADSKLMVPLQAEGTAVLVRTSRSSQSAQGGRVRPFRLMAKAVWGDGTPVPFILPDVSDPFVVTTRRTQQAEKALVPRWTDSVSKLPGVGKETFAKLKDLRAAGLATPLANYRIQTVGQLFEIIDQADHTFLQDLGRALGLKSEKVAELQENARTVAKEDSRKRVWGSPDYPSDRLVYPCKDGAVELLNEHIEVMRDTEDGAEILDTADLPPEDLMRVVEMRQLAFASWWAPGHPGWGIIDELSSPVTNGVREEVRPPEQTLSLRQQMDRQCKQRRVTEPSEDPFPNPVESEPRLQPDQYLGVALKKEPEQYLGVALKEEAEPSSFDYYSNSVSVSAPEHVMPGRSVFDTDAYPENGGGVQQFSAPGMRETNPNARDISNAPSAGTLLEQPIGLAYITAAPNFERSGPIRFKRTVSGNRYKPMPSEGGVPQQVSVGHHSPILEGQELGQTIPAQHQPVGVFQGLPPKPSRELRSQTSLDKVAYWQQTRPLSSSNLGERFSQNLLNSLLGEGIDFDLDERGDIDYAEAEKFGF